MSLTRLWVAVLGLVCALEVVTHAGSRNGFLQSSRPPYSLNDALPAEGYVSWAGTVPVLHDAEDVFKLVAFWLGERGPADTGILDRRAGYAYLASLAVPWAGAYAGYLVVNWLFWWGAAAAAYWLARQRWGIPAKQAGFGADPGEGGDAIPPPSASGATTLALAFSCLVATGHGLLFMAGVPMSYLAAYASLLLVLALGERLQVFGSGSQPGAHVVGGRAARLGGWLLLGWAAGVASTLYFAHVPIVIFWWVYGGRRAPWRYLLAGTAVALGISVAWEAFGRAAVGLGLVTDNSAAVGESLARWLTYLRQPYPRLIEHLWGTSVRGTLLGAFALPWWLLAAAGFVASTRDDREWALALGMAGVVPAIVILSLLPLPRAAFYMYPAVYLLAARGALALGRGAAAGLARLAVTPRAARLAIPATVVAAVGVLALVSNADLLGYQQLNQRFHFSAGDRW